MHTHPRMTPSEGQGSCVVMHSPRKSLIQHSLALPEFGEKALQAQTLVLVVERLLVPEKS